MTRIALDLPDEVRQAVAAQASRAGMSVGEYLTSMVTARVAAQAEAEHWFATRAGRSVPGRAERILSRIGREGAPEAADELPADLAARLAARRAG